MLLLKDKVEETYPRVIIYMCTEKGRAMISSLPPSNNNDCHNLFEDTTSYLSLLLV